MTKGASRNERFGAIPMRAFSDTRLSRTHLAVLGVISSFDRFGRNGAGCYARQERIAELAACTPSTVSKRVGDLSRWGYLKAERQKNRRRVQYNVIHEPETCPTGQVLGPETCPTGQVETAETCPTGQTKRFPLRGSRDSGDNPLRHPSKSVEKDSPEGACEAVPAPPHTRTARQIAEVAESEWWAYKAQLWRYVKDNAPLSPELSNQVEEILTELVTSDIDSPEIASAFESISYELPQ
jgi:hypothetical protein